MENKETQIKLTTEGVQLAPPANEIKTIVKLFDYYFKVASKLLGWNCITTEDMSTLMHIELQLKFIDPNTFDKEFILLMLTFSEMMNKAIKQYNDKVTL